jgi:hemerythrin-like domain-containing protein
MNITEALVAEHAVLRQLFDHVDQELPHLATLESLTLLARIIANLLHSHGEDEEELVLCALDHSLEDQGRRERFFQEHQELDERFNKIQSATDPETARSLLQIALQASRKHFIFEEESLFPFADQVLGSDLLLKLGRFRAMVRAELEAERDTP